MKVTREMTIMNTCLHQYRSLSQIADLSSRKYTGKKKQFRSKCTEALMSSFSDLHPLGETALIPISILPSHGFCNDIKI